MPVMQGFGFFEKRHLRSAINDAKNCINRALQEAFADNDRFQIRMDTYFGSNDGGAEATSHLVMKTINSMKLAIDSDLYKIVRGDNTGGNDNARMQHISQRQITFGGTNKRKASTARLQGTFVYQGKAVNVLEQTMFEVPKFGTLPMTLYDLYFELPYKSKDKQSQVETFLHELSHLAGGTIDVDKPNCYEYSGVLHCKNIGKGAVNAESYGMFLQSYIT